MLCLGTNTTNAQIADGLYHYRSTLLHTWDDFVLVKKDTAYIKMLSEIHGTIGHSPYDTLIKQNDSLYESKRSLLVKRDGAIYFAYRKRKAKRNRYKKLTYENAEIRHMWDSRHNKLLIHKINDAYFLRLWSLENNNPSRDELLKAYYALGRKAYELSQPAFAEELQAFKQKYLQ